jgi:protein-disulfide isomerase
MKNLQHFLKTPQGKIVAGILGIIALLFVYYFSKMSSMPNTAKEITVTEGDHVRGAKGAQVTLVEFGDFQCPACGAYEPLVRKALADNKDTLQVVFKHFPLTQIHHNALLAAKAAEAASVQGKFWEMHDILYDKQKEWGEALNARDFIVSYANTIGLDAKKFLDDLANKDLEAKIIAETKEGINFGVQGTPTFFLNGTLLDTSNLRSAEAFGALIRAEVEKSKNPAQKTK